MELHLILKKGVEYNDEYNYIATDNDGDVMGEPVKAFKNKDNAISAMRELEEASRLANEYEWEDNREIPLLYYLETIQVEDENLNGYTAQRQALEAAKDKMRDAANEFFLGQAKQVFDRYPKLQAIRVTAYTPYFNDGDTCEYSVNGPYVRYEGRNEDGGDYKNGFEQPYVYQGSKDTYPEGMVDAYKESQALITSVTEEDFRSLFGDHVQVTVTREGTTTEQYSHE